MGRPPHKWPLCVESKIFANSQISSCYSFSSKGKSRRPISITHHTLVWWVTGGSVSQNKLWLTHIWPPTNSSSMWASDECVYWMDLILLRWFPISRIGEVKQAFQKRRNKYTLFHECHIILGGYIMQCIGGTFLKLLLHFQTLWSVLPCLSHTKHRPVCSSLSITFCQFQLLFSKLLSSKSLNVWPLSLYGFYPKF